VSVLAALVAAVRAGESRVLVVRGEPGVGKTALLDLLAGQAEGCRVVRVAGMQSEMELAFAGLHQLLAPMLDHLEQLPAPQREALRTVLGLSAGLAPDRFLVALAVLSLLAEAAGERPLVCVIDDAQWLDQASAQALGFVGRRLGADPVGLVLGARVTGEELSGLPELSVEGLAAGDARALLESALAAPLDARVRDQIVAETGGNPLALLELPRGLTPAELAGGFGPKKASGGGWTPCRLRPGGCCCWRRPIRPVTRRCCGGRRGGRGFRWRRRQRRRSRRGWQSSARGSGSATRWCARRPIGRRRSRRDNRCTGCWRR
jgi:AAA ATPase domain